MHARYMLPSNTSIAVVEYCNRGVYINFLYHSIQHAAYIREIDVLPRPDYVQQQIGLLLPLFSVLHCHIYITVAALCSASPEFINL